MAQEIVTAIVQDGRGGMWFGSQNGLTRYDGRRTIVYRTVPGNPRSLADNRVQVLHVDARDRQWGGTRRGLQRFDPAHGDFTHFVPHGTGGSANPTVQAIGGDGSGRLRLGTNAGCSFLIPPPAAWPCSVTIRPCWRVSPTIR